MGTYQPDTFKGLPETIGGILEIEKAKHPAIAGWIKIAETVCEPIPFRTVLLEKLGLHRD